MNFQLKLEHSLLYPTHPFKTHPDELLKFLEKIFIPIWNMWGIQMVFYNAYYLARFFHTDEIIPSNVNIVEGYLLEMKGEEQYV